MEKLFESYSKSWSSDSIRLHATPSYLAKTSFFYIQECGYFKTDDSYFTERQYLKSYLIAFTVSGKGILEYEGNRYEIAKGQLFFVDCAKHHKYSCAIGENWEFIWFHFNGLSSAGYYDLFSKNGSPVIYPNTNSVIIQKMNEMIELIKKKQRDCEAVISMLITEILTEIVTNVQKTAFLFAPVPSYVSQAAKMMDTRFSEGIKIHDVCAFLGYTDSYLSREFKKHMRITMTEYLTACRVDYAKELLKYSSLTVGEITARIGMNSVDRFIIQFKKKEGVTPFAYRKQWISA
ncbi:MAG: helix-turn-helix domain-containing protein [Clostridiales bacterium]|nr:helix-turn-helix domain-containing protein [Clostridiales bacterium]